MSRPDLNLLVTLDVLLTEGSVARAAKRLKLSPSAMSRALARLRDTVGDPLLVRAGRGLVPTPRALALRGQVGQLVHDAEAVLRPTANVDLRQLARTFTLRTSEGFVETFGPMLIARTLREAPHVRLRFAPKPDKSSDPLREGSVDLETGVVDGLTGPELLTQALFHDRLVGVVRPGHALSNGRVTAARYAREQHVSVARGGKESIDEALEGLGLAREIAIVLAGGFATAIALARETDLVAAVPARHTERLRADVYSFPLPFATPEFTVSLLWHPRLDADAAHRWLRGTVRDVCREQLKRPPRREKPDESARRRAGR